MRKIILLRGLPGSGKSTFAKELINKESGKYKRVSKDDLRAMLDNGKWSKDNEKFILEIRDAIVIKALEWGKDVIVDDTNLSNKHFERMKAISNITGFKGQVEVEIEDFTSVPIEQCIKQDLKRVNSVGEAVIRRMYNQFLKPKSPVIIHNPKLPDAIICDLDGTLALFGDNNPYDRDFSKDVLNKPVADILIQYLKDEYIETRIIIVSGRKDIYRDQTVKWLHKYNISYRYLFMRKADDNRKDSVVKEEIYKNNIEGKFNIKFVLDDRNSVISLWRSLGLPCFQVAEGDF